MNVGEKILNPTCSPRQRIVLTYMNCAVNVTHFGKQVERNPEWKRPTNGDDQTVEAAKTADTWKVS